MLATCSWVSARHDGNTCRGVQIVHQIRTSVRPPNPQISQPTTIIYPNANALTEPLSSLLNDSSKEVLAFRTRTTSKIHLFVEFATPEEAACARGKYAGGWQGDPFPPRALMPVYKALVDAGTSAVKRVNTYRWDGKAPIVPELLPPAVGSISLTRTPYAQDNAIKSRHEWNERPWRSDRCGQDVGRADEVLPYGDAQCSSHDMGGRGNSSHGGSSRNAKHERDAYVHGTWYDGKWLANWEGSGATPHPPHRPRYPRVQHEHELNDTRVSEGRHPRHYTSRKEPIAEPMSIQTSCSSGTRPMAACIGSLYSDRLMEDAAIPTDTLKHDRTRRKGDAHRYISNGNRFYEDGGGDQYDYRHNYRLYSASPSQITHHSYSYHHDQHHHRHERKHGKRRREAEDGSLERRLRSKCEEGSHSPTKSRSERGRDSRKESSRPHAPADEDGSKLKPDKQMTQNETSAIKVEPDTDMTSLNIESATRAGMKAAKSKGIINVPFLELGGSGAVDGIHEHESRRDDGTHRSPPNHNNWKEKSSTKALCTSPPLVRSSQSLPVMSVSAHGDDPQGHKDVHGDYGKRRPSTTFSASSTSSRIFNESIAHVARAQGLPSVSSNRKTSHSSMIMGLHAQQQGKPVKNYASNKDQGQYGTDNSSTTLGPEPPSGCKGKDEVCASHAPSGLDQCQLHTMPLGYGS